MKFRYLKNVVTLEFDREKCSGCGRCLEVCPHSVFVHDGTAVRIADRDACMECGACMKNCASGAVSVRPGVGCAWAIVSSRLRGRSTPSCGDDAGGASCGDGGSECCSGSPGCC